MLGASVMGRGSTVSGAKWSRRHRSLSLTPLAPRSVSPPPISKMSISTSISEVSATKLCLHLQGLCLGGGDRNFKDGNLGGRNLRDGGGDRELGAGGVPETSEVKAETLVET